ncbi:hypothetical protein NKR19_g235 [Coniochaeta hoffmannii]|uniref:CST complex subunit Stn1 N-terminal domain-containing protein n=1 Tax=Coniochaeta hoffmannii TaxID=91930 RepID=A0AA38VQA7_9PEZI|nr:hypothetical protein NKR19_g235 [Coniochaeta hoffmannii]
MTGESPNVIYPQYCFHLSPTIEKWCRFRARDIHGLTSHRGFEGQDLYFHLNHPVKWVQVAGVVVAIDEFYGKRSYTIDDSSGATIECLLNVPKQNANLAAIGATAADGTADGKDKSGNKVKTDSAEDATTREDVKPVIDGDIDVGDILLVKGHVTVFRNNKQIRVYKISHLRCTEEEVQFWKKMAEFYGEVLSKPWSLTEKELRRCRKEATRSGDAEPREPKRSKRKAGDAVRTGLEKAAVQATIHRAKPVNVAVDAKPPVKVRITGLERASKRLESVAVGHEPASIPKTRTGSETPVSDPGAIPTSERVRPLKKRITGLERGTQCRESDSNRMINNSRTSITPPGFNRRRPRKAKMTGLERGLNPAVASRNESMSGSEPEIVPPVRSKKARTTGLEAKPKRVKYYQRGRLV